MTAFVVEPSGHCSICERLDREVLAVDGRPARVCADCVEVAEDIIAEEQAEEARLGSSPGGAIPPAHMTAARAALPEFACSFCGAHRAEVQTMISGRRTFICDVCVADARRSLPAQ